MDWVRFNKNVVTFCPFDPVVPMYLYNAPESIFRFVNYQNKTIRKPDHVFMKFHVTQAPVSFKTNKNF